MANKEKLRARPPIGHIGSLLYLPHEGDDDGIGTFETSRRLFDPPEFRVVRPLEIVKPTPKLSDVEVTNDVAYAEKLQQNRWLKNTLPEASLGTTAFDDLLGESQSQPGPRESRESKVPAAAGEISDHRNPWRVTGVASLAMATGEGGQILRLLRLSETPWLWEGYEDVALGAWGLKPADREEEAYWCQGAAPITRIKFFTHLALHAPLRWLIVQKESKTTILSPVYHSVPVSYENAALEDRPASRVDPNEILSFTAEHTGGRAHVDVDVNPPSRDSPLQVAIIDDHGGWSIWNVSGELSPNSSPRSALYKRGAFWEDLPDEEKGGFGLLWYHPPPEFHVLTDNADAENTAAFLGAAPVLARPSQTLLLWNRTTIQVLDARVGFVSYVAITQNSVNKEKIQQIQSNPSDPSQALVLTTHSMICLDICPGGEHEREKPRIVHAYLHDHPANPTLQFSASTSARDSNAAFVLIYPKEGPRASIFWFYGSTGGGLGQFSHQLQYLRREDGPELDNLRTLCVLPVRLASYQKKAPRGPGSMYRHLDIEFRQVVSIGRRQSMGHWVCATVNRGTDKILPPEPWKAMGYGFERDPAVVGQIRRRVAYVNYMADKFVVPDSLEDVDAFVAPQEEGESRDEKPWLEFEPLPSVKREILVKRRFYPHVALEAYHALLSGGGALRNDSLEAVRQMLHAGLRSEAVPRRTLLECTVAIANGPNSGPTTFDDEEWARQLIEMVHAGMGVLSLKGVYTNPPWDTDDFAERLASARGDLIDHWPVPPEDDYPEAASQRRFILAETALQVVLAYHTIEVKDPSLSSPAALRPSQSSSLPFSSQSTLGYGSQLLPSQLSSFSQTSSQVKSQSASQKEARRVADIEASRAAVARLSNLATNLNQDAKLSTYTQHPVFARWDEAGVEDYVPFIQRPAEAREERLQRKRQKKAEKQRAKEEAFKRLTGRGETASSPPRGMGEESGAGLSQGTSIPIRMRGSGELMSSQSQVTMSQPVGGVFGQRPRKVKKKKGGIK